MLAQTCLESIAHNQLIDDLSAYQATQRTTIVLAYSAVAIMQHDRTHQTLATITVEIWYVHSPPERPLGRLCYGLMQIPFGTNAVVTEQT